MRSSPCSSADTASDCAVTGDLRVWFDFENTPHVLFLEPIIRRLRKAGVDVLLTARPQAQTLGLAAYRGLSVEAVGGGDRLSFFRKVFSGVNRARALSAWAGSARPVLLVSSSRTASLAAWWLRIPAVGLVDYEYARHRSIALACDTVWLPDVLRDAPLPRRTRRVGRFFPGLKENLYLDDWPLDRVHERDQLHVNPETYLVVARPPADGAHYGTGNAEKLFRTALAGLVKRPRVRVLVLPRTDRQRTRLEAVLAALSGQVEIMMGTVSGPGLVAAADLVIGGGGTMNREAAVLGVPVWSLFDGPTPHIDEVLSDEGRLRWVRTPQEAAAVLGEALPLRRPGRTPFPDGLRAILLDIQTRLNITII